MYGVNIAAQTTVIGTFKFGVYIGSISWASTSNYSIYSAGGTMYHAGNVGIGTTVFGATAAGVLALGGTATAPTTSVDLVHLYGEDISAGNRALAVYQESAVIAAAGIASTHKIPVRWNGTTYYFMASNV